MKMKEVNMLKIVAPINNYEEIKCVIDYGADEIYFGYLDKEWSEKYGAYTGNRRENYEANITDRNYLKRVIHYLNERGIKYAVTMNGHITAIIDGIIYDTFDPSKRIMRCAWRIKS